jgi:glycerophosphoryl diester phosphodiesterase
MAYASGRGRGPVEIIGHRGSPREQRENTLASFARAFAAGADAVELDVHATRDGAVVVHHDPTTNSRPGDTGEVVAIADTTLARLRAIDVRGERIPTLEEVLAIVPDRATAYVEVKAPHIEDAVVAVVRTSDRICAAHSFDHRVARRIREIAPEVPVGILQTSYPIDLLRPMHDAQARDLWQQWELIDAELIARVQRDGGRVIAWTVNEPAVAERLNAWGIDGICTDLPALMRAKTATWTSA